MEKLSIEDKAKRYDEALARANEMIKAMTNIGGVAKVDDIQHIFPELKESEDEKIRKELIAYCQVNMGHTWHNIKQEDYIAWLEKQGEKGTKGNEREIPNSAWSEEDENIRQWIISDIDKLLALKKKSFIIADKEINWLKSLKPQTTWKPSDEQLDALQYVYRNCNPPLSDELGWDSLRTLELMYQDLKKLKQ